MMQSDDLLTSSERTRTSTIALVLRAVEVREAAAYTLGMLQGESLSWGKISV